MYDNPFIFILGIVSFLLALFSTKEIFFNRSNLEPLGKISLVGKMVGIFLSVYSYILILVCGLVFYYMYIDSRGSSEAGMIILAPFLFAIPLVVAYVLGLFFSTIVFFAWSDDYLELPKLTPVDNNTGFKYSKYPVTILIGITTIMAPFYLIVNDINKKADYYHKQDIVNTYKFNEKIKENAWWANHSFNKIKGKKLDIQDLILEPNEVPYYYYKRDFLDEKKMANPGFIAEDQKISFLSNFLRDYDNKSRTYLLKIDPNLIKRAYGISYSGAYVQGIAYVVVLEFESEKEAFVAFSNLSKTENIFYHISKYIVIGYENENQRRDKNLKTLVGEKILSLQKLNLAESSDVSVISTQNEISTSTTQAVLSTKQNFKIISPNGGEVIKIGYERGMYWNSGSFPREAQLDVEIFEITGDKIIFKDNGVGLPKGCSNCIGGGLRSGILALSPVVGGSGSTEWKNPGITYSGERLKPGSHYVIKAVVSKTGTYEKGECSKSHPICTVEIAIDWSDGVFTLVD